MTLRSLETVVERVTGNVAVRTAFGEPIDVGDRTIVPVVGAVCGFGGGVDEGETDPAGTSTNQPTGEAGGYGGGLAVRPLGVIEIAEDETRFVRVGRTRRLLGALLAGAALGWIARGRRSRNP